MSVDRGDYRLRINSAGITRTTPDWHWDSRQHDWRDYDLWVVLDGRGRLHSDRGSQELRRGSCFVLRGGEGYVGEQDPKQALLVSHTHFDWLDTRGRVRRPSPWLPPLYRQMPDMLFFEGLLRRLFAAQLRQADGRESRAWLRSALHAIAEADRQQGDGIAGAQAAAVDEVCTAMATDPSLSWSVAAQARRCGWHPDHYSRVFKRLRGCSPQSYGISLRLQLAAGRLRNETVSIGQIARELGYGDQHFFSRQFKRGMGCSPRSWRHGPVDH